MAEDIHTFVRYEGISTVPKHNGKEIVLKTLDQLIDSENIDLKKLAKDMPQGYDSFRILKKIVSYGDGMTPQIKSIAYASKLYVPNGVKVSQTDSGRLTFFPSSLDNGKYVFNEIGNKKNYFNESLGIELI